MAFTRGHALLVGVGTYQHIPSFQVPITIADAEEVAAVLRDQHHCGYPEQQVTLLTAERATRPALLAELDRLAAVLQPDDTLLVFYSGHGEYTSDGDYYLTTHDTQLDNQRKVVAGSGVSQHELLERIRQLEARRVLLLFNACHAGEVSPVLGAGEEPFTGATLPQQTAEALLSTGSGRIIITACRDEQFSFVGDGPQTIFAHALVAGLRGKAGNQRGYISAFDLYTYLYWEVGDQVESTVPEVIRNRYGGSQQPELTVLRGVGPFAVALYRGASPVGETEILGDLPTAAAARAVSPERSQAMLNQLVQFQTQIQARSAGRDLIEGDQINAQEAQGFINRPTGPVSQNFGQQSTIQTGDVQGPVVGSQSGGHIQYTHGGNIHTGNITGSGIAVGTGAQASYLQGGTGVAGNAFAPIYTQLQARSDMAAPIRQLLEQTVRNVERAVQQLPPATQDLAEQLQTIAQLDQAILTQTIGAVRATTQDTAVHEIAARFAAH